MNKRVLLTTRGIVSTLTMSGVLSATEAQAGPPAAPRATALASGSPQTFGFTGALQSVVSAGITNAPCRSAGPAAGTTP
jgi:hypothetical protein